MRKTHKRGTKLGLNFFFQTQQIQAKEVQI